MAGESKDRRDAPLETGLTHPPAASLWRAFLIVYATALALCALDLLDGKPFDGDIDDILRAIQIKQLMSPAGQWWNLALPMIGSPEVYLSPWSRLVDLPYVLLTKLASPLVGQERAISLAFLLWPPLLLAVYSLLAAMIVQRLSPARNRVDNLLLAATTATMLLAVWEFVPGRIDHHNMQIVALMAIMAGLVRWDRPGGLLVGLGTLASVAIALEGLPFVAVVFAGLILCVLRGNRQALEVLAPACLVMLVATIPLALLLLGPAASFSTQCDAFSAPYILLLMGCAGILLVGCIGLSQRPLWARLLVMAIGGAVLLVAFAKLFPLCLSGPYWMIDPLSRALWFDRIAQEQDFAFYAADAPIVVLLLIGVQVVVAAAALPRIVARLRQGEPASAIILAVAVASLLLTLLMVRYIRFPFAFAPLFLPMAFQQASEDEAIRRATAWRNRVVWPAASVIAIGMVCLRLLSDPAERPFDAVDRMAYDDCRTGDFSGLANLAPGHIIAPGALALSMAASSMPEGFTVGGIPYHRAAPGLKRAFEAFTSSDLAVRRAALEPFDYVAVCRFPLKLEGDPAPLYDALSAGGDWPGLNRVPTDAANRFQIFRIDHAALQ
jgi:hypothetical protein